MICKVHFVVLCIFTFLLLIPLYTPAQSPGWLWARKSGGSNYDYANAVVTDVSGNVYAAGYFESGSITFGSNTLISAGNSDLFLVKYDPTGTVLWARSAGGSSYEEAYSLAIDNSGNILIAGYFQSASVAFGATVLTNSGSRDIFLAKYDPAGNVLWAKRAGGSGADEARSVVSDPAGNIYVAGRFSSSAVSFGTTNLINTGVGNAFIAKYDYNGNVLWAKCGTGSSLDAAASSVAGGVSEAVYLAGNYYNTSITFGAATLNNAGTGQSDIFLVKYDTAGTVQWAKRAGGAERDIVNSVSADGSGNAYIAGFFRGNSIVFGSTTLNNAGGGGPGSEDVFLAKYDSGGNVKWARGAGGANADNALSVKSDLAAGVFMAGVFQSPSITFGTTTLNGTSDMFIAKYDSSGNSVWAKSAGGSAYEDATSLAIDVLGNVFTAGYMYSDTVLFGSDTLLCAGNSDMYIAKLPGIFTAVTHPDREDELMVYPNPSSGKITLSGKWNRYDMVVTDMPGVVQLSERITGERSEIDLSRLKSGVYLVQVYTGSGILNKKIVIQK